MKTTTARTSMIATELMRECMEGLVQDHEEIAQAIMDEENEEASC